MLIGHFGLRSSRISKGTGQNYSSWLQVATGALVITMIHSHMQIEKAMSHAYSYSSYVVKLQICYH